LRGRSRPPFALHPLDFWTYLLALAAPPQVCHPALEAAVAQQPLVLVRQVQGLHPLHEGSGIVHASSCAGRFEGCGADRGARGEKAFGSVVHAKRGGDRCGGGCVLGVKTALVGLSAEQRPRGAARAVKTWEALMVGSRSP
jgi:hypothetical protein